MTLTCNLDLELVWLTQILHIDLLRRTFDQSLMKIFQRVQEIWSGLQKCYGRTDGRTDGRIDGQTDRWKDGQMDRRTDGQTKAISIIPQPLRGGGLKTYVSKNSRN